MELIYQLAVASMSFAEFNGDCLDLLSVEQQSLGTETSLSSVTITFHLRLVCDLLSLIIANRLPPRSGSVSVCMLPKSLYGN